MGGAQVVGECDLYLVPPLGEGAVVEDGGGGGGGEGGVGRAMAGARVDHLPYTTQH